MSRVMLNGRMCVARSRHAGMSCGTFRARVCAVALIVVASFGAVAGTEWKDASPIGKDTLLIKSDADTVRIDPLAENLFRVRITKKDCWEESALNRYGVIARDWPACAVKKSAEGLQTAAASVTVDGEQLRFKSLVSAADLAIDAKLVDSGYKVRFPLLHDERIYGLGDVSRDNIQRRPGRYEIWVKNVNSYIPIPMALSSKGWGVFMNTTWRNHFDVGKTDKDALVCEASVSPLDFYVFCGRDYRALLDIYTRVTGRPALLPIFGYGFTYVCNENVDMFALVNDALRFRDMNLPCDVLGLEPGWMNPHAVYDYSVRKKWDREKFEFGWNPAGGHTFIGALNRINFKLSLWLCCDYDLFKYEEECAAGKFFDFGSKINIKEATTDAFRDARIESAEQIATLPKAEKEAKLKELAAKEALIKRGLEGDEPWFSHLRKFVRQGAQCFKLDGARQVTEHPNRKWANGMTDEEAHNLYPLVYGKQMSQGFETYTGKRSMVYSAGGYAGVQKYVATWAGDTGGGARPCASLLNLGMSGHANQSCDMGIFDVRSLHFGFLQTWSQENSWAYWLQPWLQSEEGVARFRKYVHLRYRLIPYIYTAAAEAHATGWPVVRALPFEYPDVPSYDECKTTYMLGPNLLVCAYTNTAAIPKGTWYEWRTDRKVVGPVDEKLELTQDWGGGLYVKAGAAIPTWPVKQSLSKGWNEEIIYEVWAGADGESSLYEDDGLSLNYRKGGSAVANTKLTVKCEGAATRFTIGSRNGGSFGGSRKVTVNFHALEAKPTSVTFNGKPVEFGWCEQTRVCTVGNLNVSAAGATLLVK